MISLKHGYLALLLPALIIAPLTRVFNDQPVPTMPSESLYESLSLEKIGQFDAANQGPYTIMGYKSVGCEGSIALLKLERNAEGAHILRYFFHGSQLTYGFVFAGKLHTHFPQAEFTLQRIRQQLQNLTSNHPSSPHQALAYVESGQCGIAEQIANVLP